MFSRFICINYMNHGKCTDKSCTLQHVTDIDSMNKGSVKSVASNWKEVTAKKPATAVEESKGKSVASEISIISGPDSKFAESYKIRKGALMA